MKETRAFGVLMENITKMNLFCNTQRAECLNLPPTWSGALVAARPLLDRPRITPLSIPEPLSPSSGRLVYYNIFDRQRDSFQCFQVKKIKVK